MRKLDLKGKKFNRLLIIDFSENKNNRTAWICKCDCGNIKTVNSSKLISGHTKSCGCLNDEKRSVKAKSMFLKRTRYHPSITSARRIWKKVYSDGNLTFEQFLELSQKNCYYCNAEPSNIKNSAMEDKKSSKFAKENGQFKYNGLDRIDNNLGHDYNNCVPCCKWCNYSKRDRSLEDFKNWIVTIYNHLLVQNAR
jgi:hypothetical protein